MVNDLKVFIVGSPRSGTSITYYAMQEVIGLPGYGESHVFPIFQRLIHEYYQYAQSFAGQTDIAASRLDTRLLKTSMFAHIHDLYARLYADGNWVDKTPGGEGIRGIPVILDAFPAAKIIIARRTGIETVNSIMKKFSVPFDDACTIWNVAAEETLRIRTLGINVLEVDQFDMTNDPARTGQRIAVALDRADKAGALAEFFSSRRTDQLSQHNWTSRVTLDGTDWSDADKATFKRRCGAMMNEFGYPM